MQVLGATDGYLAVTIRAVAGAEQVPSRALPNHGRIVHILSVPVRFHEPRCGGDSEPELALKESPASNKQRSEAEFMARIAFRRAEDGFPEYNSSKRLLISAPPGDPMIDLSQLEAWFVTGSQHLYGPETLKKVEQHATTIARALAASPEMPVKIVAKP